MTIFKEITKDQVYSLRTLEELTAAREALGQKKPANYRGLTDRRLALWQYVSAPKRREDEAPQAFLNLLGIRKDIEEAQASSPKKRGRPRKIKPTAEESARPARPRATRQELDALRAELDKRDVQIAYLNGVSDMSSRVIGAQRQEIGQLNEAIAAFEAREAERIEALRDGRFLFQLAQEDPKGRVKLLFERLLESIGDEGDAPTFRAVFTDALNRSSEAQIINALLRLNVRKEPQPPSNFDRGNTPREVRFSLPVDKPIVGADSEYYPEKGGGNS